MHIYSLILQIYALIFSRSKYLSYFFICNFTIYRILLYSKHLMQRIRNWKIQTKAYDE